MKSSLAKPLLFLCALLFAGPGVAGCGEMQGMCLVISGGEETERECSITQCANVHSYWEQWDIGGGESAVSVTATVDTSSTTVDGEPGLAVPQSIVKDGLTCYSTQNLEKTYCATDIPR
ncbi:hypothetical protein [Pseudomonas sp. RL]|uniref:hypothetical protein n=1 Tax=Pseudomonas sp. RL TaxID=1452718 RepID=UPI000485543C|nr:hypothetical protein [Pseudomonas sp. RL]